VKDSDLAGLKTIFGWAVSNLRMPTNPATAITIKLGKSARLRSKGFTDAEAKAILSAALNVQQAGELPGTFAAKRWVPCLCAYTGARVGELAQLRKEDVRQEGEHWVIRVTPEAGTVKTNEARKIVIHPHLIELGFANFASSAPNGHLFLKVGKEGDVLGPLQGLKNRLAEFARAIVTDPNVAPNHGWRHRFKTVGMEAGVAPRILDAIQGQAARSVADTYGDVTVSTMAAAIGKLPRVNVAPKCSPQRVISGRKAVQRGLPLIPPLVHLQGPRGVTQGSRRVHQISWARPAPVAIWASILEALICPSIVLGAGALDLERSLPCCGSPCSSRCCFLLMPSRRPLMLITYTLNTR
jgi:integrase